MEFVWNVDPDLIYIQSWGRGIRYYGLLYAVALMGGFYWWRWQMTRAGRTEKQAERFLTIGIVAVIGGARLGHCFFYDWDRYGGGLPVVVALFAGLGLWARHMFKKGEEINVIESRVIWGLLIAIVLSALYIRTVPPGLRKNHPLEVFFFWQGGLASHGTTIAILACLYYYARTEKLTFREVGDRLAMSIAWGACMIRLGNLMNSEIVGRITDGPIKAKFPRHDQKLLQACESCGQVAKEVCDKIGDTCYSFANVPWRHPSQIYEAALGLGVLLVLLLTDKLAGGEKRPLGLLFSMVVFVYFCGRFAVEYVKEYQALQTGLTMGQWLSIPFILGGLAGLVYSIVKRESATGPALETPADA